jgi:hypothetical protein
MLTGEEEFPSFLDGSVENQRQEKARHESSRERVSKGNKTLSGRLRDGRELWHGASFGPTGYPYLISYRIVVAIGWQRVG